jgi:hypothetical protein
MDGWGGRRPGLARFFACLGVEVTDGRLLVVWASELASQRLIKVAVGSLSPRSARITVLLEQPILRAKVSWVSGARVARSMNASRTSVGGTCGCTGPRMAAPHQNRSDTTSCQALSLEPL